MSSIRRVMKNAVLLYLAYIFNTLLSFFFSITLARELGDEVFGKYSFAVAFTMIFAVCLDLGFNLVIIRDVAKDKSLAPKYIGNIIIIKSILSVVVFGPIALVISLMDYPNDTTIAVLIFGVSIILTALADVFTSIFTAFERMEYQALVSVLCRMLTVGLGLTALFLGYGLIEIALAVATGSMFNLVSSFIVCIRKFAKPKIEIDFDFLKKIIKLALPITFLSISGIIFTKIDTVMLSVMKGDAVVGWYNAAYNLVLALHFIPDILLTALFPAMAVFSIQSLNSLKTSCEHSMRYLLILGLPIAIGVTLLADRIIPLLYGDEFIPSAVALQILAWDTLLFFLCASLGTVIISINKQNSLMVVGLGCAVFNVILNLILIPPLDYRGAGIATVATGVILLALDFYLVSKYLYRPSLHKIVIKPLIAGALMAMFIIIFTDFNLPALIITSAVLYFAVLYLLGWFSQEDYNIIRQIIRYPKQGNKSKSDN